VRTAALAMIRSPILIPGWVAPQVPTRTKVWTPSSRISSTPIATEGPPIPLETADTGVPLRVPVKVRYSRLKATSRAPSRNLAMTAVRAGSPGISTYLPTSSDVRPTWYFRSLTGRLV